VDCFFVKILTTNITTYFMNKTKQELYASPDLRVVEIKVRQVLCGSGDGTLQQYDDGSWKWSDE